MSESAYHNTDYNRYLRKAIENEVNLSKPKYVGDETPESFLKRIGQFPTPNPAHDDLDSYVNQFARRVRERLDYITRRALEEGKHGVKVTTNLGDNSIMMEVSDEVPFGEIQYHTELGREGPFGS